LNHKTRKVFLGLILGVSVFVLLAPTTTAFFATANLPPPGWRAGWPGSAGANDVSTSVVQTDNQLAVINMQTFTGGPIGAPQFIGAPPGGQNWVWVVQYSLTAQYVNPPIWVTQVQAAVRAELWLIRGGVFNWKCTEIQGVIANAQMPLNMNNGWLYLYDGNAQYRQGDIYFLYVHSQGRYFDNNLGQWVTTAQQSVSLYYLI
jgi:hypothetical protein